MALTGHTRDLQRQRDMVMAPTHPQHPKPARTKGKDLEPGRSRVSRHTLGSIIPAHRLSQYSREGSCNQCRSRTNRVRKWVHLVFHLALCLCFPRHTWWKKRSGSFYFPWTNQAKMTLQIRSYITLPPASHGAIQYPIGFPFTLSRRATT